MLVDTNVLLRSLDPQHPQSKTARAAAKALRDQGRKLHLAPQNLIELWAVATRPIEANGFGWDAAAARAEIERLESVFTLLPETPAIYPIWKRLVSEHGVAGKSVHDARLAAAIEAHGLSAILTFDRAGFARFDGLEVVHPAEVR